MSLLDKIAVLIIFLVLPSAAVFAQSESNEKAPVIALRDLKDKTVRLEDFKGKVILLNFWATWCVPCRAEVPELVRWQKEYQAKGLQIVGITYPPTNPRTVRSFAQKNKINYPILFGTKRTKALFDKGDVMPYSVIIDRDGNIKDRIEGVIFEDEFDEKIKPLLEAGKEAPERYRASMIE